MAKKTAKTQLFSTLRRALGLAIEAEKSGLSTEQFLADFEEKRAARRRFMKNAGAAIAIGAVAGPFAFCKNNPTVASQNGPSTASKMPRIAIIGAGMAGLNTLHQLKKAGLDATIYESSGRTSGRIFTVQNAMGEGTWAEFGAEFIDTNHADMWALAKEFDIELIDYAQPSEAKLEAEAFYFEGKHRPMKEVVTAFRKFAPKLKADIDAMPETVNYTTTDARAKAIDNMNLSQYLTSIGAKGWPKRLIEVCYESEYGLAPTDQSGMNIVILISPDTEDGKISWFGDSDERYKARGGNMRIPDSIAQKYPENIRLNQALEGIKMGATGSYSLNFKGNPAAVECDYLVLALPFTRLRQMDLSALNFPELKMKSINELGYGTNAKLMIGQKTHHWRKKGFTGLVYSDNGVNNGWDNAQLQTPDEGPAGLSILFGGPNGIKVGEGSPESQKDIYLPKWEKIWPGATANFNGKVARMHWPTYPHNLGSYVCARPGQYTTIIGMEQQPVGNIFFAGEHCGGDFSGYMNGAAQSGRQAAEAIAEVVKKGK